MKKSRIMLQDEDEYSSELVLEEIPIQQVGAPQKMYSTTTMIGTSTNNQHHHQHDNSSSNIGNHSNINNNNNNYSGILQRKENLVASHHQIVTSNLIENQSQMQQIRTVHVHDEARNEDFCGNSIKTTKYEFWNFIPKNLFEQFHRFANCCKLFDISNFGIVNGNRFHGNGLIADNSWVVTNWTMDLFCTIECCLIVHNDKGCL